MATHPPYGNDELFFRPSSNPVSPGEEADDEAPRPLRINKHSPQNIAAPSELGFPSGPAGSEGSETKQQWAQYRVPTSAAYGAPISPPPTGPLPSHPYQTARRGTPAGDGQRAPSRTATPSEGATAEEGRGLGPPSTRRTSMAASDASAGSGHSSRRTRFDAGDPNRPTIYGYGSPQSLSPQMSGGSSASRLAERRGKAAKNIVPPDSPGGPEPPPKSLEQEREGDEESGTLFSIPVMREPKQQSQHGEAEREYPQHFYPPPLASSSPAPAQQQSSQDAGRMQVPRDPAGINRLSSTASTSTTRASRGSPPPPETPIDPSGGPAPGLSGIEARYAASGIPGQGTLNEMQAQSAAAAARRAQYASPQPQRGIMQPQAQAGARSGSASNAGGRWSPTERPGSAPHGPPIAFQGTEEVRSRGDGVPNQIRRPGDQPAGMAASPQGQAQYPLANPGDVAAAHHDHPHSRGAGGGSVEQGVAGMSLNDEPPPAYEPPAPGSVHSPYPNEKGIRATNNQSPMANGQAGNRKSTIDPNISAHPAFASRGQTGSPAAQSQAGAGVGAVPTPQQQQQMNGQGAPYGMQPINVANANAPQQTASPGPSGAGGPASPPPLPEGWIAHLDNNSGQYYYIHLPTQSTQWEFPKGPTPLNLAGQEPMSPTGTMANPQFANPLASPVGSVFKQPLASPGFGPMPQSATFPPGVSHGRPDSVFSMNTLSSPTAAGFTGPPPASGVDMYKIQPANGVYFGPYLRYTNMDIERGLWLGSIMLICDTGTQPPTIHIHQSLDLSPNPRQLKAHPISSHQRWVFYRYDVDLRMDEAGPAKWTYAITSHLGCTRYEFLVAGRYEHSWRFVAHSGNDFALNISANERTKLGGVGLMWKDVLLKHTECGGFHAQVGLGGQISADRLWKDIPALKQWTALSGKENRKLAPWTPKMEDDVTHAFFHYYTSHFDQPAVREAWAQIPSVCCLDDHDIFDGWGSYPEYLQSSHVFQNLGRLGVEMYLLFQHHTTPEILRAVSNDIDLFTITGNGWHFVKYLGPSVVLVGPDTRSERTASQVMAGPTYQGLFPKIAVLPPSVQHCIWLFPVPLLYPRLDSVEQVAHVATTGKKMVTGGFNMLGKMAGGVAGVVGAKGVVTGGFEGVKRAVGKSGLMGGILSPFGEVEVLDEVRDLWVHESKDLERTYIIRTLQGISHNKSLRMTFLSGSVNVCGAGLVHDPSHPSDHKTMYQLITSSIVNAPQPSYVLRMLHSSSKPLYVPANGHRSTPSVPTDTKEDMMEIFAADVDGKPREHRRLMGRRNYLACVAYDPELVQGAFGTVTPNPAQVRGGSGRLSLAADFMVQGDVGGVYGGMPMKYGPVVVPSLEYGR
ncbi:hypothetical protein KC345_g5149 [Hortaea werneckii]|nr:hypothetical protein KC345_g5149 [Hortaea werneckii]